MTRHRQEWAAAIRTGLASALAWLTPRLSSLAMLPLLLAVTGLCRLARRLIDGA